MKVNGEINMKIFSFGEIIWDVYPDKKCLGGAPLNFSAHAVRGGAEAYLISAVGNDSLGSEAVSLISDYGVKTDLVFVSDKYATGRCNVTLSDAGVPKYEIEMPSAYDCVPFPENITGSAPDALNFGTLALRGEENRIILERIIKETAPGEIFVDVNLRAPFYSKESVLFALENATMLKVSDEELPELVRIALGETDIGTKEDGVRCICEKFGNIGLVILTCGGEGSFAYEPGSDTFKYQSAIKTEVVSTVGAGDSYGATFLTSYLAGKGIEDCLLNAAEVSSFVVSRAAAIPLC